MRFVEFSRGEYMFQDGIGIDTDIDDRSLPTYAGLDDRGYALKRLYAEHKRDCLRRGGDEDYIGNVNVDLSGNTHVYRVYGDDGGLVGYYLISGAACIDGRQVGGDELDEVGRAFAFAGEVSDDDARAICMLLANRVLNAEARWHDGEDACIRFGECGDVRVASEYAGRFPSGACCVENTDMDRRLFKASRNASAGKDVVVEVE